MKMILRNSLEFAPAFVFGITDVRDNIPSTTDELVGNLG